MLTLLYVLSLAAQAQALIINRPIASPVIANVLPVIAKVLPVVAPSPVAAKVLPVVAPSSVVANVLPVAAPMPVVVMLPGLYTMQDPNMQFSDKNGVCFNTGNYQTIWIPYLCSIVPTSVISSATCNTLSLQGIIDMVNYKSPGYSVTNPKAIPALALKSLLDLSNAAYSIKKYYSNGISSRSCLFSQGSIDASTFPSIVTAFQILTDNADKMYRAIYQNKSGLVSLSFPAYILPKACSSNTIAGGCQCLQFTKCGNVTPVKSSPLTQISGSLAARNNFATQACSVSAINAISSC
jgi:hypothetical protein